MCLLPSFTRVDELSVRAYPESGGNYIPMHQMVGFIRKLVCAALASIIFFRTARFLSENLLH